MFWAVFCQIRDRMGEEHRRGSSRAPTPTGLVRLLASLGRRLGGGGSEPPPYGCTQLPLICRGDSRIARFCRSGCGRFVNRPYKVCACLRLPPLGEGLGCLRKAAIFPLYQKFLRGQGGLFTKSAPCVPFPLRPRNAKSSPEGELSLWAFAFFRFKLRFSRRRA